MTPDSLADFLELPIDQKVPLVTHKSVLYAQQFDRPELDLLCKLADQCRFLHKHRAGADFLASLLPDQLVLNFFIQPSSRTFLSFAAAQAMLGMKRMSLRDLNISSMSKGETLADSIRTFISYVDLVVMRHPDDNAGEVAFWIADKSHRRIHVNGEERPIPIISGGSGKEQHPTQALLDIYTLEKSFSKTGGFDGKTLMLVGDLGRGRTVRSLAFLTKNYQDVNLIFAAPEKYQMRSDVLDFLDQHNIKWRKVEHIDDGIKEADAVYMTRIQDEWDNLAPGVHAKATSNFIFKEKHLDVMKSTAVLMHPLPKRDEVEESVDYADDPRVVYWRQERNGMWMRTALIARTFGVDQEILNFAL